MIRISTLPAGSVATAFARCVARVFYRPVQHATKRGPGACNVQHRCNTDFSQSAIKPVSMRIITARSLLHALQRLRNSAKKGRCIFEFSTGPKSGPMQHLFFAVAQLTCEGSTCQ